MAPFTVVPVWGYISTMLFVGVFAFIPYIRKPAEWFVTIIHEVGHGLLSLLTGGGIKGIKLHYDGSGVTTTSHRLNLFTKITRIIVLYAGYAAPIYLGIALLLLVRMNMPMVGFYILVATGLLTLLFIRNWFGVIIVALYLLVLGLGVLLPHAVVYLGLFFGWLFLIRGVWDLLLAGSMVFRSGLSNQAGTDFNILSDESMFKTPAIVWYLVYIALNILAIGAIIGALVRTGMVKLF